MLFVCAPLKAQTNRWSLVANIPETNLHISKLIFPDSVHGYLFGWKPLQFTNPTYEDAVLYRTIDGGMTWQKINFQNILGIDTVLYDRNSTNSSYLRFDVTSPNSCVISNSAVEQVSNDPLTFYWSGNNGTSWFPTRSASPTLRTDLLVESALHDHQIVALNMNSNLPGFTSIGEFGVSATDGAIFDDIRWDSTLLNNILDVNHQVMNHTFDYFDDTTWIVTVSDKINSFSSDPSRPYHLVTLLAKDLDSDADPGTYWEAYRNIIPDFPSDQQAKYFDTHCVRGTQYVYMFSGYGGEGQAPFYGINYLYSWDKGRSWNADSSFAAYPESYRRAITASAPSEVWCTIIPYYSIITANTPAIWIAHTTDFGVNWDIDSSSLFAKENQQYDGRTITFSDKNHGWMFAQSVNGQNSAIFRYNGPPDAVPAVEKVRKTSFIVYPDPVGNEATIRSSDDLPIIALDIFDILGRKWPCEYELKNEPLIQAVIKTNGLPPGSYLARVREQSGIIVIPFIVRH